MDRADSPSSGHEPRHSLLPQRHASISSSVIMGVSGRSISKGGNEHLHVTPFSEIAQVLARSVHFRDAAKTRSTLFAGISLSSVSNGLLRAAL